MSREDMTRLVERLRRTSPDFHKALNFKQERPHKPINPDGPEAADAITTLLEEVGRYREQGQAEGFAAAVQWLRDRSAMKPPASLWHAASLLADQMEQSRIPAAAVDRFDERGE
jgi:hypothetical protein